jgi:radical SAM-linked protein
LKAQRLRFRYRVTETGCTLTQRDLIQAWGNAAADAGLSLALSEGKRQTAQISLAAPLPQNVTSDGELAEVYLSEPVDPEAALRAVAPLLPPGVETIGVEEIGVGGPSLQSQLRWAEYEVDLQPGVHEASVRQAVQALLDADTFPAEYRREAKVREYDLRPLVLDLQVQVRPDGRLRLLMRLRAEPEMTGRADQVVAALGLPPAEHIHRTHLQVDEVQAAVAAYRRSVGNDD